MNAVADNIDRQLDEKVRGAVDSHDSADNSTDSSINNEARGAQIVQIETLGQKGLIIMLVMFVVIAGLAVLSGYALGAGEERDETVDQKLSRMDNRVYVLEYDSKGLCAQLLANKVVEVCH